MVTSFVCIGVTGIITATVVKNVLFYIICKFFLGFFFGGAMLVYVVILIELYPSKHRMWAG